MAETTQKTAAFDPGKFSPEFIERLQYANPGTVVGFFSNFLKGKKVRSLYKGVLEIPIMALNKPVQKGKVIENPDIKFFGGCGRFQGKPMVFITQTPLPPNALTEDLFAGPKMLYLFAAKSGTDLDARMEYRVVVQDCGPGKEN